MVVRDSRLIPPIVCVYTNDARFYIYNGVAVEFSLSDVSSSRDTIDCSIFIFSVALSRRVRQPVVVVVVLLFVL